jgi:protein NrfD
LGTLHIVFWIWPFDWLIEEIAVRKAFGAINGFFALLTILYTGLLLGTFRPIPFWCNPLLPVLFLISGLSTGIMATRLGVVLWNLTLISTKHPSLAILTVFEETLILAEGMAVYFYLQGSHILVASRASVAKVVWGDLSTAFWIGFVLLGLVVPFGMTVAEQVSSLGSKGSSIILTVLLTVPGLVGGYVLRHLIVAGGVKLPVNVGGIMVPLPPEV